MRYWLGVTSKAIVAPGATGGICQLHSKKAPLQRRRRGDHTLYYSPNQKFRSNQSCQAITACGVVTGNEVYRHENYFPRFVSCRCDIKWQTPVRKALLDVVHTLPDWSEVSPNCALAK